MLQVFRKGAGSWFVKGFMGLLILSFLVWGIADVFRNFSGQTAAKIGKTVITQETFRRIYTERLQQLNRQVGRGLTPEQARAIGLDRQILNELFGEAALDEKARALGLGISDDELARKIRDTPAFKGPGGFNHDYMLQVLRQNGYTEAGYVEAERKLSLRQQIGRAIGGDVALPKVMREAFARYENEERNIEFVILGKNQAGSIPAPTPEQLNAYYEERKASFGAPEYRKIIALALTPDSVASAVEISDADIQKLYESSADRFTTPEKRVIDQIVFPTQEEAAAASARIASGLSFDALAAERKLTSKDTALGTVTKSDMLDRAVAEAAFSLPLGKTSAPIAGRFGTVIVRVQKIEPGAEQPLASVADTLHKEIAIQRARRLITELHDKIEDERASGSTLPEIANKLKLKTTTIEAVDRSGRKPNGDPMDNLPARAEIVTGAFRTQPGVETDAIELRNEGSYVWYDVAGLTAPRERSFDEVRPLVESRWMDDETVKKLAAIAETVRSKVESGEPFSKAMFGAKVERREKLNRTRPVDGFDNRSLARFFETAEGKSGIIDLPDGIGKVVYRVTNVNVPAAAEKLATTEASLSRGLQEDLLGQYILRVESEMGVSINEATIRSLTGADRN